MSGTRHRRLDRVWRQWREQVDLYYWILVRSDYAALRFVFDEAVAWTK